MNADTMRRERNSRMDKLRKRRMILAQLNGVPTSLVDAAPIRVRINALVELGYSFDAIAATYGTGTSAGLRLIAHGTHKRAERKFEQLANLPVTLAVHPNVGDSMWVPTLGAQRRLRALMRLGWRHEDVRAIVGRSTHVLVGNSAPAKIKAIDWRLIDAAYRSLSATPGPSHKSRTRAEHMGYPAPLAWEDIDNPRETPRGTTDSDRPDPVVVTRLLAGQRIDSTRAEKFEAMRRWLANGGSQRELCRMHGWGENRYVTKDLVA